MGPEQVNGAESRVLVNLRLGCFRGACVLLFAIAQALERFQSVKVRFKFCNHGEDVGEEPVHRVGRVIDRSADVHRAAVKDWSPRVSSSMRAWAVRVRAYALPVVQTG